MRAERDARIRERAYHIWVEEGRVHGKEHEHWRRAEREIAAEEAKAGADSAVTSGGAGRAASAGPAAAPARKPRGKASPKRDAPPAETDTPPARRRQREPSGAGS